MEGKVETSEVIKFSCNQITDEIVNNGYFFVGAKNNSVFNTIESDWFKFAESWNELELDTYMMDGGKYRYRKHAVLKSDKYTNHIVQIHNTPHYQSYDYNSLNGGIERWYKCIDDNVISSNSFGKIIEHALKVFNLCEINNLDENWSSWYIEAHQFRIIANNEIHGEPTPEGIHKDGVSYIFMMPIHKDNIKGGISSIYDNHQKELCQFEMKVGDATYVDDTKMFHGVSGIFPVTDDRNGIRDMLVLTFKKME